VYTVVPVLFHSFPFLSCPFPSIEVALTIEGAVIPYPPHSLSASPASCGLSCVRGGHGGGHDTGESSSEAQPHVVPRASCLCWRHVPGRMPGLLGDSLARHANEFRQLQLLGIQRLTEKRCRRVPATGSPASEQFAPPRKFPENFQKKCLHWVFARIYWATDLRNPATADSDKNRIETTTLKPKKQRFLTPFHIL